MSEDEEGDHFLPQSENDTSYSEGTRGYGVWYESRWNDNSTFYLLLIGLAGTLLGMLVMGAVLLPLNYSNLCNRTRPAISSPASPVDAESQRMSTLIRRQEEAAAHPHPPCPDLSWQESNRLREEREAKEADEKREKRLAEEAAIIKERAARSVRRKEDRERKDGTNRKWRYSSNPPLSADEEEAVARAIGKAPLATSEALSSTPPQRSSPPPSSSPPPTSKSAPRRLMDRLRRKKKKKQTMPEEVELMSPERPFSRSSSKEADKEVESYMSPGYVDSEEEDTGRFYGHYVHGVEWGNIATNIRGTKV